MLRPRELLAGDTSQIDGALSPLASPRVTRVEDWTFEPARARASALRSAPHDVARRLRSGRRAGGRRRPRARSSPTCANRSAGELTHVRDIGFRVHGRRAARRSRHAPAPQRRRRRRRRTRRLAARHDRPDGDGDGRPAAPRSGCCVRSSRWRGFRIASTPSKTSRFTRPIAARMRELLKGMHDIERLIARISLGTAGPRDLVALGQSLALLPRLRAGTPSLQAPLLQSLAAEIDELIDVRDAIEGDDPERAARARARRRRHSRRRRCRARRVARHQPRRQARRSPPWKKRSARARASRRSRSATTACSGTTSRSRNRTSARCRPTTSRKQTIAGGERFITPALKEYEDKVLGADERICARELELFEALRARVAAEAPRILDTARAVATLDVLAGAGRNGGDRQLHQAARARRRRVAGGRRAASDRRAARQPTRSSRTTSLLNATDRQLVDPDRARTWAASRRTCGRSRCSRSSRRPDRSCRRGSAKLADRRSHLRARRRLRQHHARPVDVHGRDAGDRVDSARGDEPQPRHPRRDRPRHGDVRRPQPRLGGRRAPGVERPRAPEDDLRHALPRADRSRRRAAGRRQLSRRGARVQGRHRLPAQDRAGTLRSQLRHSGGAARRPAAVGRAARGGDPRARSSRTSCSAAAGRASAGAPGGVAAAARALPGAAETRSGRRCACARSTSIASRRSRR